MIYRLSQAEEIVQNGFHVLYICSAARSGSTLTDMFIGGHSQTASLGEINLLGNAISLNAECSCGDKLSAFSAAILAFAPSPLKPLSTPEKSQASESLPPRRVSVVISTPGTVN